MHSLTSASEESISLDVRLRLANQLMFDTLRGEGPAYAIAFVCECGEGGCFQTVWLTAAEYEAHRADSRPILPARDARSWTREILAANVQAA